MTSIEDARQRGEVVALLRDFGAADSALGRRFAKQQGMHPTDAAAIVEVLDAESHGVVLTPARLAERIGLTAGATSSLVNRLEAAGHLVRTHGHRDRRVVELHSTDQVHADAEAFFAPVAERLDAVLIDCSAEELAALTSVLGRLRDAMHS